VTDENDDLSLKELCEASGVSERTVRYYMAQGLIPPALRSGPGVRYPAGHLTRLRLIRRWQDDYLPLEQIRKLLANLSDAEVERLFRASEARSVREPQGNGSAADYVRRVLGRLPSTPHAPLPTSPTSAPDVAISRSQWERCVVDEDAEIHIRRPLSHVKNRRVDALLAEARRLLKESS
jgi:DNA-binding transcriptional MerR regulator